MDVEHLPDRSLRLWLREGASVSSLGTVGGVTGMYPVVKERVAHHLGLTGAGFHVELHVPRPSYVRDGDHMIAVNDDGRRNDGIVRGWLDASVLVGLVGAHESGIGLFAPEKVTFATDQEDG